MAGSGLSGIQSLLKTFFGSVAGTFWKYSYKEWDEQKNTEIRNKLQDLYGDATGVVFHQVITKLQDDYDGNLGKFKADFFFPAVTLLVKLKEAVSSLSQHDDTATTSGQGRKESSSEVSKIAALTEDSDLKLGNQLKFSKLTDLTDPEENQSQISEPEAEIDKSGSQPEISSVNQSQVSELVPETEKSFHHTSSSKLLSEISENEAHVQIPKELNNLSEHSHVPQQLPEKSQSDVKVPIEVEHKDNLVSSSVTVDRPNKILRGIEHLEDQIPVNDSEVLLESSEVITVFSSDTISETYTQSTNDSEILNLKPQAFESEKNSDEDLREFNGHVIDGDENFKHSIDSDRCLNSDSVENSWPLVIGNNVLVNFLEIEDKYFENGDFSFFLKESDTGQVKLCLKYVVNGNAGELIIPEGDFGKLFTMEWKEELISESSEDLGMSLQNCLVSLEDSVDKLRWENVVASTGPFHHKNDRLKHSLMTTPGNSVFGFTSNSSTNDEYASPKHVFKYGSGLSGNLTDADCDRGQSSCRNATEDLSAGRSWWHNASYRSAVSTNCQEPRPRTMESTDGREIDKPRSPRNLYQHRHLDPPKTILDVDYKLLQSGVAVLPGSRDHEGKAVLLLFTASSLWKNQQIVSTDLARLIMYYYSVPRETVRCRGLTIIADIRGCTTSTVNTLLESLYLFEGNNPHAVSVVHLLSDKHTQSLVLKSPIYDVHATFPINLLLNPDLLYTYISIDQLPPVLEGLFPYNHDDWIRFHMRLDPFVSSCRSVAKYLINVIQELSVVNRVPSSAKEATHLVDHHDNLIKAAFEDPRVQRLQNEGEAMLNSLQREEVNIGHSDDYRYAMEDITRLFKHVQDTIGKLTRLSDNRLHRLEKCLQLKHFDEECSKVISWLHTQGNECLQRHLEMADNLKGVRSQQKEFEKFYFAAISHIEKGNDLLEEAGVLAQSGDFEEVTGYKELAKMLKRHLQEFSERLEETRERIEGASRCYQLLDKTYEWALEAMKYVASMKMEHCATPEGLEKLLRSLELYLQEHPPISEDTFKHMSEIAHKLKNDKLIEQCQTAENRCLETQKMLTLRGNTLKQFKDQLEQETVVARTTVSKTHSAAALTKLKDSADIQRHSSEGAITHSKKEVGFNLRPSWEPKDTSTPVVPKTYSRTQAEKAKAYASINASPSHSSASSISPTHSSSSSSCPSSASSPAHLPHPLKSYNSSSSDPELERNSTDGATNLIDNIPSLFITEASPTSRHWSDSKAISAKENLGIFDSTSLSSGVTSPVQTTDLDSPDSVGNVLPRNRHARKSLKRAISTPQAGVILEEDLVENIGSRATNLRHSGRTDSMITGSSDSLPSLPEEDEGVVPSSIDDQSYIRREWTPVPVNTHLTEQSCNTPTRPFADLKLTEAEIKSRRTLSLIMSEMVQTERDYVCSLRYIVENYIPEMDREELPQALRGKRNVIFGNIEKIYQFHRQYFLQEMEASRRNPFLIARYFLMHEAQFHLYTLYNKNKPKSDSLMAEYGKTFFRQKQLELGDKMDLSSYLLKPVQRMGKYALLIKQVLKECPNTSPEYQELKNAEEMVRFQLRHGNDLLAMDALKDCDVNLQEQGKLLRQEEFLVYHGRRKYMRHVFLFEDLILFSKTKRSRIGGQDTYTYKHSIKMSDIGITEDFEGSGYKFEIWFRRRTSGESYVLQAQNSDVKKWWVRDITKLLWSQAIKNRENRLSELATMGIGNKPCLDIKPSADNIQDRFINIAVGNRGARTRNSIAVCSVDQSKQGNKRPHSIISTSSNSSSNSSHSGIGGFGGIGAMNLAFNPMDSPRAYRKSLTFMSTESGIGTDISSTDMDYTLKYDHGEYAQTRSPPQFAEFVKPRLLNLEPEFVKPRPVNLAACAEEVQSTDV